MLCQGIPARYTALRFTDRWQRVAMFRLLCRTGQRVSGQLVRPIEQGLPTACLATGLLSSVGPEPGRGGVIKYRQFQVLDFERSYEFYH